MKKQALLGFAATLVASLATFLVLTGGQAFAATKTWVGTDCPATNCNWSNTNNWVGGVAPVNGDDIVIDMSSSTPTSGNTTVNDITNLSVASITASGYDTAGGSKMMTITTTASPLTIGGNVTLNTPSTAAPGGYENAGKLFIDGNLILSGNATFTNAVPNNSSTFALGGNTLTIASTSLYNTLGNSTINFDSVISGNGTVNIAVGSDLVLFMNNANTYTGTTNIQTADYISSLGGGVGMFGTSTINLSASSRILFEGSGTVTIPNTINVTPPTVTGTFLTNQLEFWSNGSSVTFNAANIALLGNARFGINDSLGTVTVNLAGITANGHCVQYGTDNIQAGNFQNGPTACTVAVANNTTTTPAAPNTGFALLKSNPVAVAFGTLAAAAGVAYLGRRYATRTNK